MEAEKPAYLHGLAKPKEDAGISSSVIISPVRTTVPSASTQRLSPWVSVHPQESQARGTLPCWHHYADLPLPFKSLV